MSQRNRHLGKQMRAALRACGVSAGVAAIRGCISRQTMFRALIGDTGLSLHEYQLVADQLQVSLELNAWRPFERRQRGPVETVVDQAIDRIKPRTLADLVDILKRASGVGPESFDELSQ